MIIQRTNPRNFGFVTELLSIVGMLKPAAGPPPATPQCPVPPPLEFYQTPGGLAAVSGGALVLGIGLGALLFRRR